MASLPDPDVPGRYGFLKDKCLGLSFIVGGLLIIGSIVYDSALCEILICGQFHFNILEGGDCVWISVPVQIDFFNVAELAEIILQIYMVPAGEAVVITSDFFSCDYFGVVGVIVTAGSDTICGSFRILDLNLGHGGVTAYNLVRRVGGGKKTCHDVGVYHLLIAAGVCRFLLNRGNNLNFIEKDTVAVALPGTYSIFNVMPFSPYTKVAGIHCVPCFQVLGGAFGVHGFHYIFAVRITVKDNTFREIFHSRQLHFNVLEGGDCDIIGVAVYIHRLYTVDITKIILQIHLVPLGVAIVVPADFFPGIDAGIVHVYIAVGLDTVCCRLRIGNASGSVCGGNQSFQDVLIHDYGFCLDCGRR